MKRKRSRIMRVDGDFFLTVSKMRNELSMIERRKINIVDITKDINEKLLKKKRLSL